MFDISSTEKEAANDPKNKEMLLLNFNFKSKDIIDNNESPAPTLSTIFVVKAGQTLVIPSNVPHGAEALEDTDVIDTFSPIRTDWLDGSDVYLQSE
mgnify:CR=1 FL=1